MKRLALLLFVTFPLLAEPQRLIVEYAQRPRGLRVAREFTRVFHGAAVEVASEHEAEQLRNTPGVIAVYPDLQVVAHQSVGTAAPGRPRRPRAAGATPAGATPAGAAHGSGITVAVIDSGIDHTHPALAGKVIGGWDFVNDDAHPMDDFRHGTHVAGIIAAQSAEMTGVAPGVKLLAYKVLNERGNGVSSDVIAAVERALADGADIANLSLGVIGHANDPVARAVENAVAAGMVVTVSAGNDGEFHRVSSPGVAESAITVGAIDGNRAIAEFSSRGPAAGSGSIKPDLVAPGVKIRSTGLQGLFIELSGTSMAAPYVAGLTALLLEEHPQWTPARVKSALVNTAGAIAQEEMMTQGSGAVSRDRALASDLFLAPTQLNFGLDATTAASWQASRTLTLHNESAAPRTIAARAEGTPNGVTLTLPEVTLAPDETRNVTVSIAVDNIALGKPLTRSLSFGGALVLEWPGGSARVPWAFIRAGRATVTYDGATPDVLWNVPSTRYGSSVPIGVHGMETLIEPGTYELAVVAAKNNDDVRVIVAEEQKIEGDVVFAFTPADAPHEVKLDAMPERMNEPGKLYTIRARLVGPSGSLVLPMKTRTVRASSFSTRYTLLLTEAYVDSATNAIQIAQHAPLRGLSASTVLRVDPGAYATQEIRVHAPPETRGTRSIQIMPRDFPRGDDFGPEPSSILFQLAGDEWRGTLTMTPETHERYASGVQFALRGAFDPFGSPALVTPMIRRDANGFFAVRGFDAPELPVYAAAGEPLELGRGPVFLPARFEITATGMSGVLDLFGDRFDRRRGALAYQVRDAATGAELSGGVVDTGSSFVPLPRAGKLQVDIRSGTTTLGVHFDTTTGTATPPAITSIAVLDGTGRRASTLPRNGNGAFVFSATDAVSAHAFFRRKGTNTWVQLTPVATGTDATYGTIYRVDLSDALRVPEGEIELEVGATDDAGSTTTLNLSPAFVNDTMSPRRRAVRK